MLAHDRAMCTDTSTHHAARPVEQRWGVRVALQALAELITADGDTDAVWVRDASLSGAFIETRRNLQGMSRVALCPKGRSGEWLDGVVVRAGHGGYGIEWLAPGLRPVSALLSLRREPVTPVVPRSTDKVSWRLVERLRR